MTPAARYAAAIEVLDLIQSGRPAEQVLTTWARQNRFAGSKDRAAIRDHVYDVLRQKRSVAARGGGTDGRALILGLLRAQGSEVDEVFGAGGYGPTALSPAEKSGGREPSAGDEAADLPDWLWPMWCDDLGADAVRVADLLRHRAGVHLRVNLRRSSLAQAQAILAEDAITTRPIDGIRTALEVLENPRRIGVSRALKVGYVELQDAASQRAMLTLADLAPQSVLDYCAGGGGKALALADLCEAQITAHDIAAKRMADIPLRAARAGVKIALQAPVTKEKFDLVLCDAPCSGSGTWRRTPDAKWALTAARLHDLTQMQRDVIRSGAERVAPNGYLAYATCSVLRAENEAVVDDFLAENTGFSCETMEPQQLSPLNDGFFLAVLRRV